MFDMYNMYTDFDKRSRFEWIVREGQEHGKGYKVVLNSKYVDYYEDYLRQLIEFYDEVIINALDKDILVYIMPKEE